jgi:hypothetical protein
VCQIDKTNAVFYAILDVCGSVLGTVDSAGTLREQYTYDPYGELLGLERFGADIKPRIGHKGLFFDRFDADLNSAAMAAGAVGTYQNRNRTFLPGMGRFLQRDPNGLGQVLLNSQMHGMTWSPAAVFVNARLHYAHGLSGYAYLRSSPNGNADPLGLLEFSLGGLLGGMSIEFELRPEDGRKALIAAGLAGFFLSTVYAYEQYLEWESTRTQMASSGGSSADKALIERIVRELGLSAWQRRRLHDEISGQNLTEEEIWEIARQIKRLFPNK